MSSVDCCGELVVCLIDVVVQAGGDGVVDSVDSVKPDQQNQKPKTKASIDQTRSNKQTYRALAVSATSPLAFLTDTAEPMVIVANAKNATHNVNRGDRPVDRACPVSVSTFILRCCL